MDTPSQIGATRAAFSRRLARIPSWRNVCAGLLVFLGVLRLLAQSHGLGPLAMFGQASMAAVYPTVFLNGTGARAEIQFETVSGKEILLAENPGLIERIPGPFWRRKIYFESLLRQPSEKRDPRDTTLGFGFCGTGRVAASLGIDEPVQRIRVRIWEAAAPESGYEFRFECKP